MKTKITLLIAIDEEPFTAALRLTNSSGREVANATTVIPITTLEILNFKESLKDIDFVEISKPTGVKNMKKYTGLPASADCIFSEFENKAPVGVKAAVRYNDLLKFKNLDKKHTQIVEGDKIKWVYLYSQ